MFINKYLGYIIYRFIKNLYMIEVGGVNYGKEFRNYISWKLYGDRIF